MAMGSERIGLLADDLRNYVSSVLENEPELSGMDAGYVAAQVEKRFLESVKELDYLS